MWSYMYFAPYIGMSESITAILQLGAVIVLLQNDVKI